MKFYRFRNFSLNCNERRLTCNDEFIEMTPRTFDVLQLLVERHGEIVTKNEILGTVWNGSYVEEGNLAVHISKLRRLLGDIKSERFIETVAGTGYRFVAPVVTYDDVASKQKLSDVAGGETYSVAESIAGNSESYKFYLRGKHFLEKRNSIDIERAIECFRKSFSADPLIVVSYVGLVECYVLLYIIGSLTHDEVLTKIGPFLRIISDIDRQSDVVQAMYGVVKMYVQWKFAEAEQHLEQALKINPDSLVARYRYSDLLILSGRFNEALLEVQKTLKIDPLSPTTHRRIGRLFWKMERYSTARVYLEEAIDLEPRDWEAMMLLGAVLTELALFDESRSVLKESLSIRNTTETMSMIGYVDALLGRKEKAKEMIDEIRLRSDGDGSKQSILLARIYLALGEKNVAYRYLDLAYDRHDPDLIGLKFDPRWKTLRNESRFQQIIRKVGLPI